MSYVYKELLNKNGQTVYLRTPLSAIDMVTTNGIQVDGNTMSVVFATKEQINAGAQGQIITASGLKEAMAQFDNVLYVGGGGINIKGGTVYAEPAPILSVLTGTEDRTDCITNAVLNGAVNLGRAVDVTTFPVTRNTFTSATNYTETFEEDGVQVTDNCIQLTKTSPTNHANYFYSWITIPKFATGLKYLIMADIQNRGTAPVLFELGTFTVAKIGVNNVVSAGTIPELNAGGGTWLRAASLYKTDSQIGFAITTTSTADIDIRLKHYMVFEVTSLSDEAIYALATMPHPEKIYEKYLIRQDAVCPWIPVINMGYSPAVTIGAGLVYKLIANDGETHTLSVDTFPEHTYGKDSYITVFVGDTSNIVVQPPLVLMDPLTPNAVNNCVVKFRDGYARIYVTDTDYGYTITVASGSGDGSLKYGIQTSTEEYIVIANQLDGERISFDGAVAPSGRKTNILGHGTDKTILTGNVSLTPTVEMHTLSLADVNVTGGTMIVPRGVEMNNGTTTVSAGLLAIDGGVIGSNGNVVVSGGTLSCREAYMSSGTTISMVSGTNGVIDVTKLVGDSECVVDLGSDPTTYTGGTYILTRQTTQVSGCTITNGYHQGGGGGIEFRNNATIVDTMITGNTATWGNGICINGAINVTVSNCIITDNHGAKDIHVTNGTLTVIGSTVGYVDVDTNGKFVCSGTNKLGLVRPYAGIRVGTAILASDTIVDLVDNANTTALSTLGGIIIQDNVHILYNHTSTGTTLPTSSVTEISGGTYGGITNYGVLKGPMYASNGEVIRGGGVVVDLNKTTFNTANKTIDITNLTFRNGSGTVGGAIIASGSDTYSNCVFSANSAGSGGAIHIPGGAPHIISSCTFTSNTAAVGAAIYTYNAGSGIDIRDCVFDNGQTVTLRANTTIKVGGTIKTNAQFVKYYDANSYILVSSGTILDFTGCSNALPFNPGSGVTINGGMTVKYQHDSANNLLPNSSSYSITGATFTVPSLRNDNVIDLGGRSNILISGTNKTLRMSNCVVQNGSGQAGGCVVASECTVVLSDCILSGGTATYGGGIMANVNTNATLKGCTITGNAGASGGALYCGVNATMLCEDCVISGNTNTGAVAGNLLYVNNDAHVIFSNCTLNGVIFGAGTAQNQVSVTFAGDNVFASCGVNRNVYLTILISAGATLDFSSNALSRPLAASKGIIVGSNSNGTFVATGSATVLPYGGGAAKTITGSGTNITSAGVLA